MTDYNFWVNYSFGNRYSRSCTIGLMFIVYASMVGLMVVIFLYKNTGIVYSGLETKTEHGVTKN